MSFRLSAAALIAAPLVLPLPAAALQLSAAGEYNALIFGDLTATGGDTEGRLAIGGDAALISSYSVGQCTSGALCADPANVLAADATGTRADLLVAGDLSGDADFALVTGNAVIGGSKAAGVDITVAPGDPYAVYSGVGNVSSWLDFAAAETALKADSLSLAAMSSNGTVTDDGWAVTLTGTDPDVNVFTLDAAVWGRNALSRYIDVPAGAAVIINISGAAATLSGGTVFFGETGCFGASCADVVDGAARTITNFYEATTVTLSQLQFEGSLLAPLALLEAVGGQINGQAIAASASLSGGIEFHYRQELGEVLTTGASVVAVPAPGAGALLAAAAGALALRARRRAAG